VSDLAPLVLLYLFSRASGGGSSSSRAGPPEWPTTHSPPPPLPAFAPHVPKPPQHGTPLEALHKGAQKVTKTSDVLDKAGRAAVKAAPTAARQAAAQAAHSVLSRVRKGVSLRDPFSTLLPSSRGVALVSKSVADLQAAINARGGTLTRDGLYGPQTAAAWAALARAQGLPADIQRAGPKVARVAINTWDVLSVPAIP
jgi:hypothetical protein